MKVKSYTHVSSAQIAGVPEEHREWIDSVLESRDKQIKDLTTVLTSRLDFDSNFNAEIREITVPDATEVEIRLRSLKSQPVGVVHLWNENGDDVALSWAPSDQDKLKVTITFASSPTDEVLTRLLIIGK